MTDAEKAYVEANTNPRAELDYAIANGQIDAKDALTAEDLEAASKKGAAAKPEAAKPSA